MPQKYRLEVSTSAERDLATLYEYGFVHWGEDRADHYFEALIAHFDKLCENPFLYPAVDDIRPGYHRSICGIHSVYYKVSGTAVQVMAVIGRQDFR
ncbi:type II toxin-antitoxin system RelE/ParE family toxin [Roseibium litorale]|uniref:Type II toxin-antitoxin system RelE/ParE family toxin n=1 Tax=Roseibium litorale TaxID=2803841 RepID=A0ABR9CTJ7_9HYPH|nr:type II toxin-antitoxin system RelE/ParE family toxin [Roseibium litorale]MBD8894211.1 type II toxin-antitoxin system RelE/ParE family toxin [Roseibium litorale]